ncbi:DUF6221 family protein [Kitasatospora sp. NPDC005856]|uniref:DUF6221 family protein n=1 Tax=Kitasatospora sp. NPDC005856 TaxID=3154566 RepID=UPI0034101ED1
MTDDLLQFLTARLDEDEQAARLGTAGQPLTRQQIETTGVIVAVDGRHSEECATGNWAGIAEHIVRHDPARVLAEVDAKRRIMAEHQWRREPDWPSGRQCRQCATEHPCSTLRLLVLSYATHPNYRPAWAPGT